MNNSLFALAAFAALTFLSTFSSDTYAQDSDAADAPGNGWVSLFNGEDLEGWTPKIRGYEYGENYANTFRVEDGVLKVRYDQYEGAFDKRYGHLFYKAPYSHYILRLEYRFVGEQAEGGEGWANRNSGIMIHGQPPESMERDQDFPVSIEVQLLGGNGDDEPRPTMNLCTPGTHVELNGKLFKPHCTISNSQTYDGEVWVSCEVEVRGNEIIRHRVEGETVIEYSKPQLDKKAKKAKKLIPESGDVQLSGGSISLQSESHPCEFRNIYIRDLSPKE